MKRERRRQLGDIADITADIEHNCMSIQRIILYKRCYERSSTYTRFSYSAVVDKKLPHRGGDRPDIINVILQV